MKKALAVAALSTVLFVLPSSSRGLDIQLRLSSGLWQMNLGEVNAALVGWRDGLKQSADADPNMQFVSGDARRLRLGVDFEAELVLSFSRWIKLGLSAGYGYGSLAEEATLVTVEQAGLCSSGPVRPRSPPIPSWFPATSTSLSAGNSTSISAPAWVPFRPDTYPGKR